jgi:hypothetical protein
MIEGCQWPELPDRYNRALRVAVSSVLDRFTVRAILVTGTILRETPDPRSDIDLHVIHAGTFRQRLQEFHEGVPCEIFVNPLSRIEGYFAEDLADRRPISQHMYATGFSIFDPEGLLPPLIARAHTDLERIPSENRSSPDLYSVSTAFEDVCDLADRDQDAAAVALGGVVSQLVECYFRQQPMFVPRLKDQFSELRRREPRLAELALQASQDKLERRLEAAEELCRSICGHPGFFEWASEAEETATPSIES